MRYLGRGMFTIAESTVAVFAYVCVAIGFWGFVLWAADAFQPAELVAGGLFLAVLLTVWMCWERDHAIEDPHDQDEMYVPQDWDWPAEDTSTVRNPGLGR